MLNEGGINVIYNLSQLLRSHCATCLIFLSNLIIEGMQASDYADCVTHRVFQLAQLLCNAGTRHSIPFGYELFKTFVQIRNSAPLLHRFE